MTNTAGDITRARILAVAVTLAAGGLDRVTVRNLARTAGVDHSAVIYHFGSLDGIRGAVANEAIRTGNARIIARLVLDDHPALGTMNRADRLAWVARAVS